MWNCVQLLWQICVFQAAEYLNVRIKHIPFDPVTFQVDVNAVEKVICSRTCMVYSAFVSELVYPLFLGLVCVCLWMGKIILIFLCLFYRRLSGPLRTIPTASSIPSLSCPRWAWNTASRYTWTVAWADSSCRSWIRPDFPWTRLTFDWRVSPVFPRTPIK